MRAPAEVVLGIDPGLGTTGFGVIRREGPSRVHFVSTGVIRTPPGQLEAGRLVTLHQDVAALIERHRPDVVAVERLFFKKDLTTGTHVLQARGVILLAIGQAGLPVAEYTPVQVKSAVAGYGRAEKAQVQDMVTRLLRLDARPSPDDAADALAVALAHAFQAGFQETLARRASRA